jgi:hypothetical protein
VKKEIKLKPIYWNGFLKRTVKESEDYMIKEFCIQPDILQNIQILFATYDISEYDGYAFILFKKDNKLYEVNASHCSCYGLEGQWKPGKAFIPELRHRIEEGQLGLMKNIYFIGNHKFYNVILLKLLENCKVKNKQNKQNE